MSVASTYCQPKMSFPAIELQACLDRWDGYSSGVGYIKHWKRYHTEDLQWPNMSDQPSPEYGSSSAKYM